MRLRQNQLWQRGADQYRIVALERLSVTYKKIDAKDPEKDCHETVSKKEFCRLIKDATEIAS